MTREELQTYVIEHIPIVKAMEFEINSIENESVKVSGSYKKHINHKNSVFGGSISAVMTLAGWGLVKVIMEEIDDDSIIVIKSSNTEFLKPVVEDFEVTTEKIERINMDKFKKIYTKFGKGRININVILTHKDKSDVLARFSGEFVVMKGAENDKCGE